MKGIIIIVAVYAGLIAWLANLARSLGARAVVWALTGALVGGVGFAAGIAVTSVALTHTDSTSLMLLSMFIPLVLMMAPMLATATLLKRGVIGGLQRAKWQVHILKHGDGTMRVDNGRVIFEWPDGSREIALAQLRNVHADGECVRMQQQSDEEIVVMPVGESLSYEGRKRMSAQITQRLRVALPVAIARA